MKIKKVSVFLTIVAVCIALMSVPLRADTVIDTSVLTETNGTVDESGSTYYKVSDFVNGQDHIIGVLDSDSGMLNALSVSGDTSSSVWTNSSRGSLRIGSLSLTADASGFVLTTRSGGGGSGGGGRTSSGDLERTRGQWNYVNSQLYYTIDGASYYVTFDPEMGTFSMSADQSVAAIVSIYTNGSRRGSVITSHPQPVHYTIAGSGSSAPSFSVGVTGSVSFESITYTWYADSSSVQSGSDSSYTASGISSVGVHPVYCVVEGRDTNGYYYREQSNAANFIIANGICDNSLLTFSDVHEDFDNIGGAIADVMANNDGKIPSLIVCTGDFVRGFGATADSARSVYLPQIKAQLGGIDTVYVAGNHEPGAPFVEANLAAAFGCSGIDDGIGVIYNNNDDLIVYGINYDGLNDTYAPLLDQLEAFLQNVSANYNGELILLSSHTGLHSLGIQPESGASAWGGGAMYNLSRSMEVVALINEYVEEYGLRITFLMGHDHTRNEPEFLLLPGDTIYSTDTYVDSSSSTYTSQTINFVYGHSGYLSNNLGVSDKHYTFLRWDDNTEYIYFSRVGSWPSSPVTVSAPVVNYDVTVTDDGNGTASADPISGPEGTTVTLTATPSEGYQFKSWEVTSGGVTLSDLTADTATFEIGKSDVSINATFELIPAVTYTVSFDTGSAGVVTAQTVGEGGKASKPADPVRYGYVFGGWYTDEALTSAFDFDSVITGDVILHAKWTSSSSPLPDGQRPVAIPATGEKDDVYLLTGSVLIALSLFYFVIIVKSKEWKERA